MVLGTGGERPKDALLGRGAYLRRARTSYGGMLERSRNILEERLSLS